MTLGPVDTRSLILPYVGPEGPRQAASRRDEWSSQNFDWWRAEPQSDSDVVGAAVDTAPDPAVDESPPADPVQGPDHGEHPGTGMTSGEVDLDATDDAAWTRSSVPEPLPATVSDVTGEGTREQDVAAPPVHAAGMIDNRSGDQLDHATDGVPHGADEDTEQAHDGFLGPEQDAVGVAVAASPEATEPDATDPDVTDPDATDPVGDRTEPAAAIDPPARVSVPEPQEEPVSAADDLSLADDQPEDDDPREPQDEPESLDDGPSVDLRSDPPLPSGPAAPTVTLPVLGTVAATRTVPAPARTTRVTPLSPVVPAASASLVNLVAQLTERSGDLFGVADTAQALADEIVERAEADAAAVLVPDGGVWRVSGGVGLRPLERRLVLDASHWLISEIAMGGRALLIEDTDVLRPKLAGAPLAAWRHLLAVPVPGVRAAVVLARGYEAGQFGEPDLNAVVEPIRDGAALLQTALQIRRLARVLAPLREVDSSH